MLNIEKLNLPVKAKIKIFEILKKIATPEQLKQPGFITDISKLSADDKIEIFAILEKNGVTPAVIMAELDPHSESSTEAAVKLMEGMSDTLDRIASTINARHTFPDSSKPVLEKLYNACAKFCRNYNAADL